MIIIFGIPFHIKGKFEIDRDVFVNDLLLCNYLLTMCFKFYELEKIDEIGFRFTCRV